VYSRHTLREDARADDVRDILGHANIDVTQNVYGKSGGRLEKTLLSRFIGEPHWPTRLAR
jgi:integrase